MWSSWTAVFSWMWGRKKARDVVTAITELAQKIGAKTVAEGIETQEQLDFCKEARAI